MEKRATKPIWIIEDFEKDNSFQELADATKEYGCETHVFKYVPFDEEMSFLDELPDDHKCVLFQGSIQFASKIRDHRPQWIPGVFATWENFNCSKYYTHWGKHLLNKDYSMMPLAEVARRKEELFAQYGDKFFMRPDNGTKSFTGTVIGRHGSRLRSNPAVTWDEWEFIMNETSPTELVIVSSPKKISKEWRVVCAKGEAISGSRYRTHGMGDYKNEFPNEVRDFANKVLRSEWKPDPVFVMDICEDENGELHLLEIGAFSSAGLYHLDLKKVVSVVSEIAMEEFDKMAWLLE